MYYIFNEAKTSFRRKHVFLLVNQDLNTPRNIPNQHPFFLFLLHCGLLNLQQGCIYRSRNISKS
ncbi:hypothetical protein [Aquimarina hainanensis]|uniref:hypothetical protein n=1 Tax=Aquimarina hainanensis TaxID=1578017 RepID=UPI00360CA1C9